MKKQPVRKVEGNFGGKTKNFEDKLDENGKIIKTWKEERTFEQKHLKAYLQGREFFRHGFTKDEHGYSHPNWFMVKRIDPNNATTFQEQ